MPNNIRQQGIWIQSGDPETVDDVTPYAPGMLGARVTVKQPTLGVPEGSIGVDVQDYRPKTYRYVKADEDSNMSVNPFAYAVAYWADAARYIVTTEPAGRRGRVAGVFQNALTPGHYGFIQTKGPTLVKLLMPVTAMPSTAGLGVIPSATAGRADVVAAGTAPGYPALGWTSGPYDGANERCMVDLDIPDTVD